MCHVEMSHRGHRITKWRKSSTTSLQCTKLALQDSTKLLLKPTFLNQINYDLGNLLPYLYLFHHLPAPIFSTLGLHKFTFSTTFTDFFTIFKYTYVSAYVCMHVSYIFNDRAFSSTSSYAASLKHKFHNRL